MKLPFKSLLIVPTLVVCTVMFADWRTASIRKPPADLSSITLPSDAANACPVTDGEFDGWFETGARSLNGVVKPANSVTFPNVPNCSFYKWTEQMFLWLTSPAPARYGGGKHIFDSPVFFDVSPPDASPDHRRTFIQHQSGSLRLFNVRVAQLGPNRLPVVVDKRSHKLFEVTPLRLSVNRKPMVLNSVGKQMEVEKLQLSPTKKLVALDRAGRTFANIKPIISPTLKGNAILQKAVINGRFHFFDLSGNSVEVEVGQAETGQALESQNGSLVYYSTIVNEVYAYYRTMLGNTPIPTDTKFPTTMAELTSIVNFASSKGKTLTDPEALAIEMKTAWIETEGLAHKENFITMRATIPTYDKSDPNNWVINGQKTAELALVGMHVVGSTKGHPEMLWGTFEHVSNAPNATYSYRNVGGSTVNIPQNIAQNWLFSSTSEVVASAFNNPHMRESGHNIQAISPFNVSASNTLRINAWGMDGTNAQSNTQVISVNNNVRGKLLDGDIRKNYIQTGTTWTINGQEPNGGNEVGTSLLANTTMETYQQGTNCFSCHFSNKVDVSHVFKPLKPLF